LLLYTYKNFSKIFINSLEIKKPTDERGSVYIKMDEEEIEEDEEFNDEEDEEDW